MSLLFLAMSNAFADDPTVQAPTPSTGPVEVDVYVDMSLSTATKPAQDAALVEALRGGPRADDTIRLTGFDGTLHPLAQPAAPSALDVPSLFGTVKYEGKATFYAPLWFDLAARASPQGASTLVAVVITDGESDPLDLKAKDRPTIADPTWRDAPPTAIGDTPVFWVVRDAPVKKGRPAKAGEASPLAVPAGTRTARWQEPAGVESSLVAWNVPSAWTPSAEGLSAWIDAARPALPPPLPETPPFDWTPAFSLAKKCGEGLGILVVVVVFAVFARRKAQQAGAAVAEKLGERQAERVLRGQTSDERVLRVEPMGVGGKQEERRMRPGDQVDVGPAVSWPGVAIPGLPGGGFSLLLGRRPDQVQLRPRGSRPAVALLRAGNVIPVARESVLDVRDGDLVIDAQDETPLVRIRLPAAAALGRSA